MHLSSRHVEHYSFWTVFYVSWKCFAVLDLDFDFLKTFFFFLKLGGSCIQEGHSSSQVIKSPQENREPLGLLTVYHELVDAMRDWDVGIKKLWPPRKTEVKVLEIIPTRAYGRDQSLDSHHCTHMCMHTYKHIHVDTYTLRNHPYNQYNQRPRGNQPDVACWKCLTSAQITKHSDYVLPRFSVCLFPRFLLAQRAML